MTRILSDLLIFSFIFAIHILCIFISIYSDVFVTALKVIFGRNAFSRIIIILIQLDLVFFHKMQNFFYFSGKDPDPSYCNGCIKWFSSLAKILTRIIIFMFRRNNFMYKERMIFSLNSCRIRIRFFSFDGSVPSSLLYSCMIFANKVPTHQFSYFG